MSNFRPNKIYTKFTLGQTVWFLKNNMPHSGTIKSITISSIEHRYHTCGGFSFTEDQLEQSKKELFKLMKKKFMEY